MKSKLKAFILVLLVTILVITSTLSVLYIRYSDMGKVEIVNKYYDILFLDVLIDYESSMSVKVNKDKHEIVVRIPDLSEFNTLKSFDINISNLGNMDAYVSEFNIMNVDSNINREDVDVELSFLEGDVIKGGSSEVIKVNINNINTMSSDNYYNFVIKYNFSEVVL